MVLMHWQGNKGEPGLQGMPGASGLKVILIWRIWKYFQKILSLPHYLMRVTFLYPLENLPEIRITYITKLKYTKGNCKCGPISFLVFGYFIIACTIKTLNMLWLFWFDFSRNGESCMLI